MQKVFYQSFLRTIALLMTAVMLLTAAPAVIAVEAFRSSIGAAGESDAADTLSEQTFELTPEDGVTVTLEGMMPTGGYAEAQPADVAGIDVLHACDITIYYPDGSEFEPDESRPISVSFKSEAIAVAIEDSDTTLEVEHITDNGEKESVELVSADDGEAVFEAESFSIYVIKEHAADSEIKQPRRIYHFLNEKYTYHEGAGDSGIYYTTTEYLFPNKHNDMVSTQIIKSGEKLQEVVMPGSSEAGLFYGWYVVNCSRVTSGVYTYTWGETIERVAFNTAINFSAAEDEHIYLAPLFGHYRFLTFHQDAKGTENENMIIARKLIVLDETSREAQIKVSDVRSPSTNPNRIVFWGWEYKHEGDGDPYNAGPAGNEKTEIVQTVYSDDTEIETYITIHDEHRITGVQPSEADLSRMIFDIYPVFKEARWFYFETGGSVADYVPARFVTVEDPIDYLSTKIPTREGHQFRGWYTEINGEEVRLTGRRNLVSEVYETSDAGTVLRTGVTIVNDSGTAKLEIDNTAAEQHFYAKWMPTTMAYYQVVIWKQKITDDKNAAVKTYDYEAHYDNLYADTGAVEDALDADATAVFLSGDYTGRQYLGFHYDRTEVYSGYEGTKKVNPDGSTIVNVYYDRDLMTVTYHYKSSQLPSGTTYTDSGNRYISTESNDGTQYAREDNGTFTQLVCDTNSESTYQFPYRYQASSADDAIYGVVGNTYVTLKREAVLVWEKTGAVYTPTTITTSNSTSYSSPTRSQYIKYNGGFSTIYSVRSNLYFNNKKWYRTRSGRFGSYTYSDEITEAYTRTSSGNGSAYTGTRYTLSGVTMSPSSNDTDTQYGVDAETGVIYTLSSRRTGYIYLYHGTEYSGGTRYTRTSDNTVYHSTDNPAYNGQLYSDTAGTTTLSGQASEYFGKRDGSDIYERLTKLDETYYTWRKEGESEPYTGKRFKLFAPDTTTGNFDYKEVWTGLFDQSYSKYGYFFPSEFKWNEQADGKGTTQTLLTGFTTLTNNNTQPQTDYHLYCQNEANTGTLVHLRQRLDGSYAETAESCDVAHVSTGSVNFKFSDKFDGFHVIGYSMGTLHSDGSGITAVSLSEGEATVSLSISSTQKVYVYHKRVDDLKLEFNDNNSTGHGYELTDIKYEQPLAAYEDAYTPPSRAHYSFGGWYEDVTCTVPFNFKVTMPNANKMVYAKWIPERYRITIDINGGELPLGSTFATYFNVDYNELIDEYAAVKREYVLNESGTYVYFNFSYDKLVEEGVDPTTIPGALRKAFYLDQTETVTFYNSDVNVTVGGKTYAYKQYFGTYADFEKFTDGTRYSKVPDGTSEYQLYAWYKVNPDGTRYATPYDFNSHVAEDTKLRAEWTRVGKYSIAYNPTMSSTGITGEMTRYNDPLESDRKYVDGASAIVLQAPTNLSLNQQINPDDPSSSSSYTIDPSEYVFRGWRVVDGRTGVPKEDNVFYDPGDTFLINADWADTDGVIHMEAYYEKKESTIRRVDYTTLTLYANLPATDSLAAVDFGGRVNRSGIAGDKHEYADLTENKLVLDRQLNNFSVDLSDYQENFTNIHGYKLIGWNTDRGSTPGSYIPDFYADAVIGADKETPVPNVLYAVWEPMVYLTLTNTTTEARTFDLSFDYTGTIYTVNTVDADYARSRFTEADSSYVTGFSSTADTQTFTVTLPGKANAEDPDREIRLVIPDGAGVTYTVSGDYPVSAEASNLIVYNSAQNNVVAISKNEGKWYMDDGATHGPYANDSNAPYATTVR